MHHRRCILTGFKSFNSHENVRNTVQHYLWHIIGVIATVVVWASPSTQLFIVIVKVIGFGWLFSRVRSLWLWCKMHGCVCLLSSRRHICFHCLCQPNLCSSIGKAWEGYKTDLIYTNISAADKQTNYMAAQALENKRNKAFEHTVWSNYTYIHEYKDFDGFDVV